MPLRLRQSIAVLLTIAVSLTVTPPVFAQGDSGATGAGDSPVEGAAAQIVVLPEPANTATQPSVPMASGEASSAVPVVGDQGNGKPDAKTAAATDPTASATAESTASTPESSGKSEGPIKGKANEISGSFSYRYPLTVPPGRAGLQAQLALEYDNQVADEGGAFGSLWSMDIPYIVRVNKRGSDKLYSDNYFSSSLSGELVQIDAAAYGAKVEGGEFLRYAFSGNAWIVQDKKGVTYRFGADAAARQDDPADPAKVYRWMLQEVRDANGNYVRYEYWKDSGQIYPARIVYTGHGTTDGIFEVEFLREPRPEPVAYFRPNFRVATNYRISEIQAKVNGAWVRRYQLTYATAGNGHRVALASITESGQDESGSVVTLPPTAFSYQVHQRNWTQDDSWTVPVDIVQSDGQDNGVRFADVNGDGLADIIVAKDAFRRVWLGNGVNGWDENVDWQIPTDVLFTYYGSVTGSRIAEVNGDGLPDFIVRASGMTGTYQAVWLNNGINGWDLDASWEVPTDLVSIGRTDRGVRVVDANGDGLSDILVANNFQENVNLVYLNNGVNGWDLSSWQNPGPYAAEGEPDRAIQFADINADGLMDILFWRDGGPQRVLVNNGNGWNWDTSWTLPTPLGEIGGDDRGVRITDINGDNLPDVIYSKNNGGPVTQRVWLGNGVDGWDWDTSWEVPGYFTDGPPTHADMGVRLEDANGDGLVDLAFRKNGIQRVWLNNGPKADLLISVTGSSGGKLDIAYRTTAQYRDGAGALLNPKLPYLLDTAYQLTYDSGLGAVATDTYAFAGGRYYFESALERKLAGFQTVTRVNAAGTLARSYYHQGDGTDTSSGEYDDHQAKIGRAYRTEVRDSSGNLYAKIINRYERADLGNGCNFVKLTQKVDFTYDGDSTHRDKAETFVYEDATGNLTQRVEWGEVTAADDGTFTDVGTDQRVTTISYTSNATAYIVGLPSQELVTDQSGSQVRESRYYYDGLTLGSVGLGNLTKEERWRSGSTYVDAEKSYNAYGLVIQEKDPRDKTTSYAYDAYNLYPATVTNPLNQVIRYSYDYSSGKVKWTITPNSLVFETTYDGLDRMLAEKQPDLAIPGLLVTRVSYAYASQAVGTMVQKTEYLDRTLARDTFTYSDGFERVVQTRQEMEEANTYAVTDSVYGSLGQLEKESLPYSSTGSAQTAPTAIASLYTSYTYDPLLRVTSAQNAVGTTLNAYDDWKLTVTDPRGKVKRLHQDAFGNLVKVEEMNGASTYTTNYAYNGQGRLTGLTDALGNVRHFTYDGLGRRLTAQDLHAPADATFGLWIYDYDDSGNLTRRVDPNGQVVLYRYDDLNRVLTEDFTGQAGVEVTYAYDSCPYGIGQLCSMISSAVSETRVYNALGLIQQETRTIDGTAYQTDYAYDRQGSPLSITNPDGSQARYGHNAAGQLETVQRKELTDPDFSDLVTNFNYGPHGKVTYQSYANNVSTSNTYDAARLYRLTAKATTATTVQQQAQSAQSAQRTAGEAAAQAGPIGVTKLQDIAYSYDANGNITRITDRSPTSAKRTVTYTYDDLNRLKSATAVHPDTGATLYAESYTYSAIGNILTKTGQGSYRYLGHQGTSYANPHAVTSISSTSFTYDRNGNLLTVTGGLANAWDYSNRLVSATLGSTTSTSTYAYDAGGQRVKSSNGTTTAVYPSRYYSLEGATPVKHLFAGGQLVATVKGTGSSAALYPVHADHLTGSNVVTSSAGAQEEVLDYYPFGAVRLDERAGAFSEKRQFAGHEYDAETGLSYMQARYYQGQWGRFLSQDPAFLLIGDDSRFQGRYGRPLAAHLADPQLLNGYAYARNSPLTYADADGNLPVLAALLLGSPSAMAVAATLLSHPALAPALIQSLIRNPLQTLARSAPLLGDALDAQEAITGQDAFSGAPLSRSDRLLSGLSAGLPFMSLGTARVAQQGGRLLVGTTEGLREVYRGGSLSIGPHDLRYLSNGLLNHEYGVSVSTNLSFVLEKGQGAAYRIDSLPEGLRFIQRGKNLQHFEIAPVRSMTSAEFEGLLDQVKLTKKRIDL